MALQQSKKRAFDPPTIPDRLYFKIGDVASICGVETYVLRFWESQFPQLKPNKSGTGQRLYRRRDVELALKIKQLVHIEGYTLAGARQALQQPQAARSVPQPVAAEAEEISPSGPQLVAPSSTQAPTSRIPEKVSTTIADARAELREIAGLLSPSAPELTQPQLQQRRRSRPAAAPAVSDTLFPL